jgi:hypothetical protein
LSFYGLREISLNPIIGGAAFTAGQVMDAAGFIATATGAGIDSGTIASIVSQQFQSAGLVQNSQGTYTPTSFSSSNFICDASNASAMFDIVKGNNIDQIDLPQIYVDSQNVVTVVVGDAPGREIIISPGRSGPGLNVVVAGGGNTITLEQGASATLDRRKRDGRQVKWRRNRYILGRFQRNANRDSLQCRRS